MSANPLLKQENRADHPYTPLFCEENIWQLAQRLVAAGTDPAMLQVIFISNAQQQVVLFNQRNGAELGYVVWDYHVVLRRHDAGGDCIYDFDSLLPFPCHSRDYCEATFGLQGELAAPYRATLRLIPAAAYLHRFSSDRAHMRGVIPVSAFPPWPAITPHHDEVIRLEEYWDMRRALGDGSRVCGVDELLGTEL